MSDSLTRTPNTKFCFGQRVRVASGFFRGSVGTVLGVMDVTGRRSYVVRIRFPAPWFWMTRGEFVPEADLEALRA